MGLEHFNKKKSNFKFKVSSTLRANPQITQYTSIEVILHPTHRVDIFPWTIPPKFLIKYLARAIISNFKRNP